jgi:hypothetical protein
MSLMRRAVSLVIVGLSIAAAGCLVGPNYRRPSADVPASFRGGPAAPPTEA